MNRGSIVLFATIAAWNEPPAPHKRMRRTRVQIAADEALRRTTRHKASRTDGLDRGSPTARISFAKGAIKRGLRAAEILSR